MAINDHRGKNTKANANHEVPPLKIYAPGGLSRLFAGILKRFFLIVIVFIYELTSPYLKRYPESVSVTELKLRNCVGETMTTDYSAAACILPDQDNIFHL